jgi:D-glycero-alpha-D-manno-heptose-7-phosphate kinase
VSTVFAKAPLRVSFGGGGTDLPSYYRERGGFVVSAAIDKHVYMLVTTRYQARFRLKHLEWEEVDHHDEITHPILRAALARHWDGRPLEIASVADAPPGTGLGSSGAYTVCALRALLGLRGEEPSAAELAELASEIELDMLERQVGKQDQYVSAHGGLQAMTFHRDGTVELRRLELPEQTLTALSERFLLFFTGEERSASEMFNHQVSRTLAGDEEMASNLDRTKAIAAEVCAALEGGDLDGCAELMNQQWEIKRSRAPGLVTERIEALRRTAVDAGAVGVTLMGAGGGGFLLAYSERPEETRHALHAAGAPELRFALSAEGATASLYD